LYLVNRYLYIFGIIEIKLMESQRWGGNDAGDAFIYWIFVN
jgi:hypothetical protein